MTTFDEEKELINEFFVPIMLGKLRANRHKKSWKNEDIRRLVKRVKEEVDELEKMIDINHQSRIAQEAADVALFCAMIAYIATNEEK